MSAFEKCHAVTHRWEKGYSNHPRDPGGATQDGITQRVYDQYRRTNGLPIQPVLRSTEDERATIYRRQYWDAVAGEHLPPGIDLATYDFAVNSGPVRAIKYLQAALGVTVDGHIGEVTKAAARQAWERGEIRMVIARVMDGRETFLRRNHNFDVFGKGWMNRLSDVRRQALVMASESVTLPGKTAAKRQARAADPADAYNPGLAAPQPDDPMKTIERLTAAMAAAGSAGMATAAGAKGLFGDLLDGTALVVIVALALIGGAVVAYVKARAASEGAA